MILSTTHKNAIVLMCLFLPFIIGCSDLQQQTELAPERVRRSISTQEFFNATIRQTSQGRINFVLHSPLIRRFEFQKRAELSGGIQVDFFRNGKISSHLEADSGEVLRDGNELSAEGNVVVRTDSGTVVQSPRLTWTRLDGMVRSDTTVLVITQWDTLQGTSLVASQDLTYRKLENPTGVSRRNLRENSSPDK